MNCKGCGHKMGTIAIGRDRLDKWGGYCYLCHDGVTGKSNAEWEKENWAFEHFGHFWYPPNFKKNNA